MTHILEEIITAKKIELKETRARIKLEDIRSQAEKAPPRPDLLQKLKDVPAGPLHLIAEVKKASPSKGLLCENFNHIEFAKNYEAAGASAISVLTESNYFQGKPEHLQEIAKISSIPLLRKDFLFHEYQIYEAKAWGASAFLLIVDGLEPAQLGAFIQLGNELELTALVEVHRYSELEIALKYQAPLLGINNRDLRTFKTNLQTTYDLMKEVPPEIPVISESGITSYYDLEQLSREGVTGVLVGEALVRQPHKIVENVKELLHPNRHR